jgi:hypothetical protein
MFVVGIYHELNAEQRRSRSLASLADVYEPIAERALSSYQPPPPQPYIHKHNP